MKKLITATALFLSLGATAQASGPVAVVAPAPAVIAPQPFSWAGAYVGGGLTYGRANFGTTAPAASYPDASGVGGSLLGGYNWQSGNLVYGGEVALDFSGRDGSAACGANTCNSVQNNHASIRGRLGYAIDQSLVFMTLGYARDARGISSTAPSTGGATFSGAVLGVGYERMMSREWSWRADYEHYFYGSENMGGTVVDGDSDLVRMSIIRRF